MEKPLRIHSLVSSGCFENPMAKLLSQSRTRALASLLETGSPMLVTVICTGDLMDFRVAFVNTPFPFADSLTDQSGLGFSKANDFIEVIFGFLGLEGSRFITDAGDSVTCFVGLLVEFRLIDFSTSGDPSLPAPRQDKRLPLSNPRIAILQTGFRLNTA